MRNVPFSPPDVGEEEIKEIAEAVNSGWITTGTKTKQFENEIAQYCHTNKAVCLNSATACFESILHLLGIGPGDEVITSAYTFTASASPVCYVGAKLVLVDVQKDSYEMDYELLGNAVIERAKAPLYWLIWEALCAITRSYIKSRTGRKINFIRTAPYRKHLEGEL